MDSFLHHNCKRMVVGVVSGVLAGCVMLFVTSLVTPAGHTKLWWLQILASACFGGQASAYNASTAVIMDGALIHFGVCAFLGFVFGKITTSHGVKRLMIYGLVLGGLCWLASNMFAPDFFNIQALGDFRQWTRMLVFQSFTLSLGAIMAGLSTALDA
jgi:hypothetical protein